MARVKAFVCSHWPPHTPAYWCIVDDRGDTVETFLTHHAGDRALTTYPAGYELRTYDDPNPCGDEAD